MKNVKKYISIGANFATFALSVLFFFDAVFGYSLCEAGGVTALVSLQNWVILLGGIICLVYAIMMANLKAFAHPNRLLLSLKFTFTILVIAAALFRIGFIHPFVHQQFGYGFNKSAIIPNIIIPIMFLASFLVVDLGKKMVFANVFFPLVVVFGYSLMLIVTDIANGDNPLKTFDSINVPLWVLVIASGGLLVSSFFVSLIVWFFKNKITHHDNYVEEKAERDRLDDIREYLDATSLPDDSVYEAMFKTKTSITVVEDDEPEPDAELETEEDRKKRSKKKSSLFNSIPRTYHISKQSTGKWQVKLASGAKAIKLFDTQAEAIAFAKELVHTQGGSIRIHSLKGKIRK